MTKVLIITYYWPPSGGPGVQRCLKFVKYLPEFNFEPVVITVKPGKATYPVIDNTLVNEIKSNTQVHYTNTCEPFGVYKKTVGTQKIPYGGNELEFKNKIFSTVLYFIRGNLFIPDSRRGWNYFAYKKAKQIIKEHNIKTIIITSPPHSTQLIGLKLKKKFGVKWIADLRDPWTNIFYNKLFFKTFIALLIDKYYEKKVLSHADKLIVVSKSIKKLFLNKVKTDIGEKFKIIPNGYDDDDLKNVKNEMPKDEIIITYTGTITNIYNITGLLKALKNILSKEIKIKVKLVGKVNENIKDEINKSGIDKIIEYVGYVDHLKSIEYLSKSSILLLLIPHIKNNKGILTGKLFEYLGVKKPILSIGPEDGDAAEIINKCNAGKTFDYENVTGISDFILQFTNNSIHGSYYKGNFHNNYSRHNLTRQLVSTF